MSGYAGVLARLAWLGFTLDLVFAVGCWEAVAGPVRARRLSGEEEGRRLQDYLRWRDASAGTAPGPMPHDQPGQRPRGQRASQSRRAGAAGSRARPRAHRIPGRRNAEGTPRSPRLEAGILDELAALIDAAGG